MALIEYKINTDGQGNVTIVPTIKRLDPGDEVQLVTDTQDAALQFNGESPFLPPNAEKIYVLPAASAARQSLRPAKPIDLSLPLAQCGAAHGNGTFVPWLKGAGFPDPGRDA